MPSRAAFARRSGPFPFSRSVLTRRTAAFSLDACIRLLLPFVFFGRFLLIPVQLTQPETPKYNLVFSAALRPKNGVSKKHGLQQ